MAEEAFPKVGHFKDVPAFAARLRELRVDLPMDDRVLSATENSPLAAPIELDGFGKIGNRWCVHPMEGWDGTTDGQPSEHTIRRWRNFGLSGAKWIWGGEAFAVQGDGRANPNQIGIIDGDTDKAARGLATLLETCTSAHRESMGATD